MDLNLIGLCELAETERDVRLSQSVKKLTSVLREQNKIKESGISQMKEEKRKILVEEIEKIAVYLVSCFVRNIPPTFRVRSTASWSNTVFDGYVKIKPQEESTMVDIRFDDKRSIYKFTMITFIVSKIYRLLQCKETCTKRELFYQNCKHFPGQERCDTYLNQISCMLDCSLYDLNIFATSKGIICGPLTIKMPSEDIDCRKPGGTTIPHNIIEAVDFESSANFILVIEKDAIFQRFIQDIPECLSTCIFVTGKGFPDENTRALLKLVWKRLEIPIFALVDADPWGIEIMCVYRFGSLAMSHQSERLPVSTVRWLGVFPSEIGDVFVRKHESLTERDKNKLNDLLERPYVKTNKYLEKQINCLIEKQWKAEIEFLDCTENYLTHVYVPNKIISGDII